MIIHIIDSEKGLCGKIPFLYYFLNYDIWTITKEELNNKNICIKCKEIYLKNEKNKKA